MNFSQATYEEIAQFVEEHFNEFNEKDNFGKAQKIISAIIELGTVIERRQYGFAVVCPAGSLKSKSPTIESVIRAESTLWYFYISPEFRGKNAGYSMLFVSELKSKYASGNSMVLRCHGEKRKNFFMDCGFSKIRSDEEWYTMQSQPGAI